jgi:hypothetical protein
VSRIQERKNIRIKTCTDHPGFHRSDSLILRIMRDVRRRAVEELVDSVACVRSYCGTSVGFCNWLTNGRNVSIRAIFSEKSVCMCVCA